MSEGHQDSQIRWAAKVLLVDQLDRTLLFRGRDPARPMSGTWWFPPGGGLDDGETPEDGARREVREETGLHLAELGPIVHHRTAEFSFGGRTFLSEEDYFVVRVEHFEISREEWTDLEREVVDEHRWWPVAELETTSEVVYPENIIELCRRFT